MNEAPKTLDDLYGQLHQYFLAMFEKGFPTHIVQVSPDPAKLLINLEVRPVAMRDPNVWAGGVSNNGHDLPVIEDTESEEDNDDPTEYTSGLASM